MRKTIWLSLVLCCVLSLTACSKDEIIDDFNHVLESIGNDNLTGNKKLQGNREFGENSYVGTYKADYDNFTGKEILFGGTSLDRDDGNEIHISCDLDIGSGTAKVILQTGNDESKILCETSQRYSEVIELSAASNYIIIQAENFMGSCELTVE